MSVVWTSVFRGLLVLGPHRGYAERNIEPYFYGGVVHFSPVRWITNRKLDNELATCFLFGALRLLH